MSQYTVSHVAAAIPLADGLRVSLLMKQPTRVVPAVTVSYKRVTTVRYLRERPNGTRFWSLVKGSSFCEGEDTTIVGEEYIAKIVYVLELEDRTRVLAEHPANGSPVLIESE